MRTFARDLFDEMDAFGKFWLVLGLGSLAAAAAMSFDFGYGVSVKHAIFLAILSIVAAFGPMASEMLWSKGRRGVSIATALICVPLLGIEFYSHAGYTAGLRGSNIETAVVQNTKFDGAQKATKDDEDNLAMWRKQLAELQAQAPWAATVKAEALRSQVALAQKEIDLETARGGCKTKCAQRMKDKADLEQRIGTIEQSESLSKQIEATQRILDGKREKAATTEHKSSAVAHQNESLRTWVALVANGNTKATELQAVTAEQSANLAMAIAGTGLPAFALFMAGLFRRRRDDHSPVGQPGNRTEAPQPLATASASFSPALSSYTVAQLRAMSGHMTVAA